MREYAAVIIPNGKGQYLSLRHNREHATPMAGHWSFPAGKIEAGEIPIVAAARELKEEAGLVAHTLIFFRHYERFAPGTDVLWRGHYFLLGAHTAIHGAPVIGEPDKFDTLDWLSQENLSKFGSSPEAHCAWDYERLKVVGRIACEWELP